MNHNTLVSKVLIVEDDEFSSIYVAELLKNYGFTLLYAKNGFDAIKQCNENPDISLIMMDIKMIGLDGYSAAIQIRSFMPKTIIIAQSAYALAMEKERYKDAFDDYITKPIDVDLFHLKIEKYVNAKILTPIEKFKNGNI
jgi:CheY-like chemotaxis protein